MEPYGPDHSVGAMPAPRWVARPGLRRVIDGQGRRLDWLARSIGVSPPQIGRIVSGKATVSEARARELAELLDGEIDLLFVVAEGSVSMLAATDRVVG